mgnify:FL=1
MTTAATDTDYFVHPRSIVRKIWGKAEVVLFIFAGAAAEFSLNKTVDWLYFTGKLPHDPIGRLFSTVSYAGKIIFFEKSTALNVIDKMRQIHRGVEDARGSVIPDWAYRDVLYMLICYSVSAFELTERKLNREEMFRVFTAVGQRMGLKDLPGSYNEWVTARAEQLKQDLEKSSYTTDLYKQYRKHLGAFRYIILLQVQSRLVPAEVSALLGLRPSLILPVAIRIYKIFTLLHIDFLIRLILLPSKYRSQFRELEHRG